ncbi:MAG TPA: hypothetical protein VI298_07040 [Geobacteraceae bacterium]
MGCFIKWLTAADAAIFLVVAPFSWLLGLDFGALLIWSGLVVLVAGALAASAGAGLPRGVSLGYDRPLPCCICGFVPKKWQELRRSYDLCLFTGVVGFAAIGAGIMVDYVWR